MDSKATELDTENVQNDFQSSDEFKIHAQLVHSALHFLLKKFVETTQLCDEDEKETWSCETAQKMLIFLLGVDLYNYICTENEDYCSEAHPCDGILKEYNEEDTHAIYRLLHKTYESAPMDNPQQIQIFLILQYMTRMSESLSACKKTS